MKLDYHIEGGDFGNAGKASSAVKTVLKQLNVESGKIRRIVIALYEAEVNVVAHAFKGNIEVQIFTDRVEVVVKDEGPGIEDIPRAMEAGFSTASVKVREMGFGAGMGLPNIKKNSDSFEIQTELGKGTELRIVNFLSE